LKLPGDPIIHRFDLFYDEALDACLFIFPIRQVVKAIPFFFSPGALIHVVSAVLPPLFLSLQGDILPPAGMPPMFKGKRDGLLSI